MVQARGSDLLVECLENEEVQYVFQLPGEETLAITDSLGLSRKIKTVTTRHEQGAAFMAGVYGRLTGHAGVCVATLGPGATNLATGIADAYMDRAPLVAITGQAAREYAHKEYHQYVDIVNVLHPITKWNTRVQKTETIPESVRKAFSIAETEKPGSTHIEFPDDIAGSNVDGLRSMPRTVPEATRPSSELVAKASKLVNVSKRPIILAGNGVARAHASPALRNLVEKSRIPVVHTYMGKGVFPDDNRLSLFSVGIDRSGPAILALEKADLVLTVGYDFVEYAPSYWNPAGTTPIVHVDSTSAEVDTNYQPQAQLVGDIGDTLELLAGKLEPKARGHETARGEIIKDLEMGSDDRSYPMKPKWILKELREVLGRTDILVSDVGEHKNWISRVFPTFEPNTVVISNGYSSMGIGIPGALAAKLVSPDCNVVVVCGDGGFLMSCNELETAHRLGAAFVTIVFRDGAYGSIKRKQLAKYGRIAGTTFRNPDLIRLAEAFEVKGYRPERADDLSAVLEEAVESKELSIVDVPVDYS